MRSLLSAHVTMTTKIAADDAATTVRLENGQVVQRSRRGAPTGTSVSVEDLFVTVPARLKFLKSVASETGRIGDVLSQYALAHPAIKFSLICDGRLVFPVDRQRRPARRIEQGAGGGHGPRHD